MSKTKGLADLNPRTVNPRTMTDDDRERLGKTLREFGDLGGVVLNTKSGQLVGGHQRVNDFRSDPDAKVVIERTLPKPDATGSTAFGYVEAHGTRYSYREVRWPKSKEAAANLAANRVHGDFDMGQVAEMLGEFDAGFDFDLTGFDPGEVAGMLHDETETADVDPKIDHAEELRKKWGVKLGQVWQLGAHRLMCGDSTKKEDVDRLMGGDRAGLCFTSPPYALGKSVLLRRTAMSSTGNAYKNHKDDKDHWLSLMKGWFSASENAVESVWVINVQLLAGNKRELIRFISDRSNRLVDIVTWDKGFAQPAMANGVLSSRFEWLVIFGADNDAKRVVPLSSWRGTVQNVYSGSPQRGNQFSDFHAATMPIHLPLWVMTTLCDLSRMVYEPFCGSGTTLIACEQTGRQCRAIEIDPGYVAVAIQRWVDVTGGKPVLMT